MCNSRPPYRGRLGSRTVEQDRYNDLVALLYPEVRVARVTGYSVVPLSQRTCVG